MLRTAHLVALRTLANDICQRRARTQSTSNAPVRTCRPMRPMQRAFVFSGAGEVWSYV